MYNSGFYKKPTVRTGDMRFPVTIKQPVIAVNTEGGRGKTFTDFVSTFAAVKEISQSRATQETVSITDSKDFFIRWRSALDIMTKDWLINYNGKDWTIHEIEKINELKIYIRIRAKQRS